jgi:hypothetical protein
LRSLSADTGPTEPEPMFWDGNRQRILGGGITQNNVLGRTKNLGGSYFAGGSYSQLLEGKYPSG